MQKAFVLLSNLILILGVVFLDWNVLEVLLIYWMECVILGLVCIIKGIYLKARYSDFNLITNFIFFPHFCALLFGFYTCIIIFWVKDFHQGFVGPFNLDFWREMVSYFADPFMFILVLIIVGIYLFSFLFYFIPDDKRHRKIITKNMLFTEAFVKSYTIYMPILMAGAFVLFCNSILAPKVINNLPISAAKIGLIGIIIFKIFMELKESSIKKYLI